MTSGPTATSTICTSRLRWILARTSRNCSSRTNVPNGPGSTPIHSPKYSRSRPKFLTPFAPGARMPRPGEQRFLNGQGLITQWPTKRADKLLVLSYLVSKFKFGQIYTEAQVNEILKIWHSFSDWPLLRRELVEQGYLSRNRDGSDYRRTEISTNLSGLTLVKPEVERDAAAGVKWLAGPTGRETLRLMGVTEDQNHPTTLDTERNRVRDFISS